MKRLLSERAPGEAPFAVPSSGAVGSVAPSGGGPDQHLDARVHRSYNVLVVAVFLSYMALGVGLYLWRGAYFTPDRWMLLLFVGAVVLGQAKAFLRDWVPFVLLAFGYEFMRGIAYKLVEAQDRDVHAQSLIDFDRALFGGTLPTHWVQDKLYVAGTVHWYDYVALLFYSLHFVFPLVFAFMLWIRRKDRFWQFSLTFLVMTYAAFIFFLFFPAAPPWLAEDWGLIRNVEFPFSQTGKALLPERYDNFNMVNIWSKASGNPVAAFPSLHAGFPWLVLLYAVKFYGRRGLVFLSYNVVLWFSIVYAGHHWVVDILGGMAWATLCFIVVQYAWPHIVRGVRIPVPRPIQTAAGAVARPIAFVTAPVGRVGSRLRATVASPFQRRASRS
jgi:membrane-associated phospholipid phosphatase